MQMAVAGGACRPANAMASIAPNLPADVPSLDGMRAVCILMVCIAHSVRSPDLYAWLGHMGNYGVRIFFLISGFLITALLLREYARFGAISLKNFYMRRMIRICPAFYGYVLVTILLSAAGIIKLMPGDLLHTLTYTMNYQMNPSWYLTHTWSLSVEEQFYLLWPAAVLFVGPRRALKSALAVVLLAPVIRSATYYGVTLSQTEIPIVMGRNFQSVCDALATGCLLAGLYDRLGASARYRRLQAAAGYFPAVLGVLVLSALTYKLSAALYYIVGQSLANIGSVLALDYVVRAPRTAAGWILNLPPLKAIGRWSYSIYLWQELFLANGRARFDVPWPLNIICVLAAALLSYYAIETPLRRLRQRFTPGATVRQAAGAGV